MLSLEIRDLSLMFYTEWRDWWQRTQTLLLYKFQRFFRHNKVFTHKIVGIKNRAAVAASANSLTLLFHAAFSSCCYSCSYSCCYSYFELLLLLFFKLPLLVAPDFQHCCSCLSSCCCYSCSYSCCCYSCSYSCCCCSCFELMLLLFFQLLLLLVPAAAAATPSRSSC